MEHAQVVTPSWIEAEMAQLDISVDAFEADMPTEFEARLHYVLSGPQYANGRSASRLPILKKQHSEYQSHVFGPILEGQTSDEHKYVSRFASKWQDSAEQDRQGTCTPLEKELHVVLWLLSSSIPTFARAFSRQDFDKQKEVLEGIEALLNALHVYRGIDRYVRSRYA